MAGAHVLAGARVFNLTCRLYGRERYVIGRSPEDPEDPKRKRKREKSKKKSDLRIL